MKSNANNELSRLLDAFYSGSTSPSEIRRLSKLLNEATDPRYNADRQLLETLSTLSAISPPKDLQHSISEALDSATLPSHHRRPQLIITILAAAAVIVAIAVIGFRFLNQPASPADPVPAVQQPLAKVKSVQPVDAISLSNPNPTPIPPSASKKMAAHKKHKKATAPLSTTPDSVACKEITDPTEAIAYVENLLASIDLDLSPIDRATDRINKNFETINNLFQ